MQPLTMRRSAILCLALALSTYCYAQNFTVGDALPCEGDNLSCIRGGQCYTRSDLCNGTASCPIFGEDNGNLIIINSLDCDGLYGTPKMYRCRSGTEFIKLELLCDGNADCTSGGDDETNALCENKCRLPFYGNCSYSRQCVSSAFSVNCRDCLPGYVEIDAQAHDCLASVSLALDASVYNTTEGSPSVQVCVSGSVSTGNLSHIGGQSFEVNLTLSDGTALGGVGLDWVWTSMPASLSLIFDSTNIDVPQCVNVTINDDMLVEPTEDFAVSLNLVTANPFGQITLGTSSATVFIADNDANDDDDDDETTDSNSSSSASSSRSRSSSSASSSSASSSRSSSSSASSSSSDSSSHQSTSDSADGSDGKKKKKSKHSKKRKH